MAEGKIIKALSGFYYVQSSDHQVYQCRGRGVFRKKKITPLVGDVVEFDISDPSAGYIWNVKQRKNELIRPPVANIDQAIIVSSVQEPAFSTLLLDRFLVLIEFKRIDPIVFISKMDVVQEEKQTEMKQFKKDYESLGYPVYTLSTKKPSEMEDAMDHFKDKISVIAGQSGVGKSSILNAIDPLLNIETNEISKSLGRGKHTTKHVELIAINEGLVADTPGFSSLDFTEIQLDELPDCFPEMRELKKMCKFRGCMHNKEPKCAVKSAVETGDIASYRYEHYLHFFEEIKNRKPRY